MLDTRKSGDAAQDFLVESGALFGETVRVFERIVWHGEPDFGGDEVVRLKAGADFEKMPETAEQKAGADQEDERKSDFRSHQEAREFELMLAGAGAL